MPQLHSVDLWRLHYCCYLKRLKSCCLEMHLRWRLQEPGFDMLKLIKDIIEDSKLNLLIQIIDFGMTILSYLFFQNTLQPHTALMHPSLNL